MMEGRKKYRWRATKSDKRDKERGEKRGRNGKNRNKAKR